MESKRKREWTVSVKNHKEIIMHFVKEKGVSLNEQGTAIRKNITDDIHITLIAFPYICEGCHKAIYYFDAFELYCQMQQNDCLTHNDYDDWYSKLVEEDKYDVYVAFRAFWYFMAHFNESLLNAWLWNSFALGLMPSKKGSLSRAYTYIVYSKNSGMYKIGVSKDINQRYTSLSNADPSIELVAIIGKNVERELHKKYAFKRVHGNREWFGLNEDDIIDVRNEYKCLDIEIDKKLIPKKMMCQEGELF